jgi:hypothetical protein
MYGEWILPGWSPPLCGLTHDHPHYIAQHAKIKTLIDAAAGKDALVKELRVTVAGEEEGWDTRIALLAARVKEERNARRAQRATLKAAAAVAVAAAAAGSEGEDGGAEEGGDPAEAGQGGAG